MILRRIKHTILRLSPEEKVIGLGSLLVIVATFLPWYSVVFSFDKKMESFSGFAGDLGVIGFVSFLLVLLALLVLVGEHMGFKMPTFHYSKEQALFFLMGESAFLVLLMVAVYTKRSLEFTSAELRFGIYLALIGAFLGAFAAFSQIQKLRKQEVEAFFEHPEPVKPKPAKKESKAEKEELPPKEEEIPEDEMIEEIEEVTTVMDVLDEHEHETGHEHGNKPGPEVPSAQGDYFMREADVDQAKEVTPEGEPAEESEKKEDDSPAMPMSFYEDQ